MLSLISVLVGCRSRLCLGLLASVALQAGPGLRAQDTPVTWEDDALPVFRARCATCHNTDRRSADLDLTSYTGIMAGGASGAAIEPGSPGDSYLYRLVTHEDEPSMPPGGTKIPDAEIEILSRWIAGGALENRASKPKPGRKKAVVAASGSALTRPEQVALFPRLELEPVFRTERPGVIPAMAAHPWGTTLAVAAPGQVLLFDLSDLQLRGILPFPEGQPQVLRFSRSGAILLAAGGRDGQSGRVVLWDVARAERIAVIGDELDTILAADISGDHRLVALGGPQKVVRVYSVADGKLRYELRKHTDWITALEFSPDSVLLATGDRNGGLFVWHAPTGNEYLTLAGHTGGITATPWRFDSNVLVSASLDGTVRAWELENGGQLKSISAHGGGVAGAVYDRDNRLVTVGRDQQVKLWDPNGEPVRTLSGLADVGTSVAVCSDAGRIAAGDWQGNALVWNVTDGSGPDRLGVNPPPLAERLAASERALESAKQAVGLAAAETARLRELRGGLDSRLAEARKEAGETVTRINDLEQRMSALVSEREQLDASLARLDAEARMIETVRPELEALVAQAARVAELATEDIQLAEARDGLQAKLASNGTRSGEIANECASMRKRLDEVATGLSAMEQALTAEREKLGPLEATLAGLKAECDGLDASIREAESRLAGVERDRLQAEQAVARWAGELEFVRAMAGIRVELDLAQQEIDVAEAAEAAAREELAAAESRVESAAAVVEEAGRRRAAIQESLDRLRGIREECP